MRVLHISAGNLYGGVETMLVTLARYRQVLPALDQEFALCFEARLSTERVPPVALPASVWPPR
jgi:hypothetical protein